MQCSLCKKDINEWYTQKPSGKEYCYICFRKIEQETEPRIIKLKSESYPLPPLTASSEKEDEFESLGEEALSTALMLKNYEIIGVAPYATLNEVKEKCKEILAVWHPNLHKQDPEKHKIALHKVAELKLAYESVKEDIERPYITLELCYGSSIEQIELAFNYLKGIYNPSNFSYDPSLQEKVEYKLVEITDAFNKLVTGHQKTRNTTSNDQNNSYTTVPTQVTIPPSQQGNLQTYAIKPPSKPPQSSPNPLPMASNSNQPDIIKHQELPLSPKREPNRTDYGTAKAWPRFFARTFDLWWESLLIGLATAIFLVLINPSIGDWINRPGPSTIFGMLILPIALFFDAVLYSIAGNTPGKMLLGLKVTSTGGKALEFGEYFSRNMSVWFSGLALGFPLVNLFTMANQHNKIGKGKPASYDYDANYKVQAKPLGGLQLTAFVFLCICLLIVMGILKEAGNS